MKMKEFYDKTTLEYGKCPECNAVADYKDVEAKCS